MRLVFVTLGLLLGTASVSAAVTFKRVWPGYRSAESFVRLGEYFGASEQPLTDALLRSDPANRAGYYWLVRTRADAPLSDTTFELAYVLPGSDEILTQTFAAAVPAGSTALLLGLTGTTWPSATVRPAAWQLTLRDTTGAALVRAQSFLWRDPNSAASLPP